MTTPDPSGVPDAPVISTADVRLRKTDKLIAASSLGTLTATALRRSVTTAGELTGMPEEQADWDEEAK